MIDSGWDAHHYCLERLYSFWTPTSVLYCLGLHYSHLGHRHLFTVSQQKTPKLLLPHYTRITNLLATHNESLVSASRSFEFLYITTKRPCNSLNSTPSHFFSTSHFLARLSGIATLLVHFGLYIFGVISGHYLTFVSKGKRYPDGGKKEADHGGRSTDGQW